MAQVIIALAAQQEATAAMGKVVKDPKKARENEIARIKDQIAGLEQQLAKLMSEKDKGSLGDIVKILKSLKIKASKAEALRKLSMRDAKAVVAKVGTVPKKGAFGYLTLMKNGSDFMFGVIEKSKEVYNYGGRKPKKTIVTYRTAKLFPIRAVTSISINSSYKAALKYATQLAKEEIDVRERRMK